MAAKSTAEFELRKRLQEAFRSGRYLITITTISEDGKSLNHFFSYQEFPTADLIPALTHMAQQIDESTTNFS